MDDQVAMMIERNKGNCYFTEVPASPAAIKQAEGRLGLSLPEQFLEFLQRFGYGGLDGFEVLGTLPDGTNVFVEETIEYRRLGLPNNLIVIENCDEWLYCLDCTDGSVVSWDFANGIENAFDDFNAYLRDRIKDVLENL